jgi:hypothetical protein
MLYVEIVKFVEKIDNHDWFSENDLYVVIKYSGEIRRTSTKINNDMPEWNEKFLFNSKSRGDIIVEIWDDDKWSPNNLIKSYSYTLKNITEIKDYKFGSLLITMGDIFYSQNCRYNKLKEEHKCVSEKLDKVKAIFE